VSEVRLRPAAHSDARRIAELVVAAYGHYVDRLGGRPRPMDDDYEEIVDRGVATVAELDGQIIGLIVTGVDDEAERFIDNLAVDPAFQGMGVGRALLAHAEKTLHSAGASSVYLFTHEKMTENLGFYRSVGYRETDRRPVTGGSLVYLRKPLR
jgi:ribosomal protein S18 acetylase RimI-like enzyme